MDEIATLKAALSTWDMLGGVSLLLVLVGLALVAVTQFDWLIPLSWPARFPRWQASLGRLGTLLLIAGLAGEIISARSSRNLSDRIAAQLNARAGAEFERSRALEKDAAQLRLQLAHLKWRVITPEQQAALVAALQNAPRGPILVLYRLDDEPSSFAAQIRDALKAAGFEARLEQSPLAASLVGTFMLVTDLQRPPPQAAPLQAAFREIHVDLDGQQDPKYVPDAGTVVILVGARRL